MYPFGVPKNSWILGVASLWDSHLLIYMNVIVARETIWFFNYFSI
jgi:hypothetical protein